MISTVRRFMLVVAVLGAVGCASTQTAQTAAVGGAPSRPVQTAGGPTPQEPLPGQLRIGGADSNAMANVTREGGIPTPEPAIPQHEPRMAGPTPQVPIPHHEGAGYGLPSYY